MLRVIALDTSPTGLACNDPTRVKVRPFHNWMAQCLADGRTKIILPEIVDYEERRKLLGIPGGSASVRRLDDLVREGGPLIYVAINTAAMRRAARLWADARMGGYPTASPDALDGDVILAAQSLEYVGQGDRLFIATGNESDLSRYVGDRARPWEAITP